MEFSLASLPPEILDLILSRPSHSYLAIDLWKTGDPRMTSKLSSCLTCLCLSAKSKSSNVLPKILGSLHALRTLKLTSREKSLVKTRRGWRSIISSLPKTLTALIIDSRDSIFAVRNFAPNSDSPTKYITTVYKRGPSNFIDLGTLFPQLETLVLKGYRHTSFLEGEHDDPDDNDADDYLHDLENYAGVPDTVTHLGLPEVVLGDEDRDTKLAPLMPPSLTFLDTHVLIYTEDVPIEAMLQDWNLPHLERITSLEWLDVLPDDFSWLPRTLKHCPIGNLESLTISIARTLPPDLDSLRIYSIDEESFAQFEGSWLSALPKHLTSLNLSYYLPTKVADLPRRLTYFKASELDLVAEQEESQKQGRKATHENLDWPPSLSSIDTIINAIDKGVLSLLPHSLTDLKLLSTEAHNELNVDGRELPPGLRTLHATFYTGVNIFGALPTTLTHLTINGIVAGLEGGASFSSWSILPPSLTYLDAHLSLPRLSDLLISTTTITLPPNLETFKVNEFHVDWFTTLPRSLRHLNIYSVHGTLNMAPDYASAIFSGLPPLETINLNAVLKDYSQPHTERLCGAVPSESLGSLPSSLKSVSIPTYDRIKSPSLP